MGIGVLWPLLAVASLALLAGLAAACRQSGADHSNAPDQIEVTLATPAPAENTPPPRRTPTPSPTSTPPQVCEPNPDPAPPSLLQVEEPKPQQRVGIPFHVRGWGSKIGFQNAGVAIALLNAKQEVVQVLDPVPPQPRAWRAFPPGLEVTEFTRPFAADIVVTNLSEPTPFCLWVYLETTPDGTPKGVVQVPILVAP